MPERLLGLADVARELELPIQVVFNWHARDKEKAKAKRKLPRPNYLGPRDAPLWRRSTLERAGVIAPGSQDVP